MPGIQHVFYLAFCAGNVLCEKPGRSFSDIVFMPFLRFYVNTFLWQNHLYKCSQDQNHCVKSQLRQAAISSDMAAWPGAPAVSLRFTQARSEIASKTSVSNWSENV